MGPTEYVEPTTLVFELKRVMKVGTRPAKLVSQLLLPELPGLIALCAVDIPADRPLDQALAIREGVTQAARELGGGDYGQAVQLLMGLASLSKGLLVGKRRELAAEQLGTTVATLIRHREDEMLADLAAEVYARRWEAERQARMSKPSGSSDQS